MTTPTRNSLLVKPNLWTITLEDITKQPPTADASLYNGQPTDTGSSCPSAGLTSCTPSISKDKGGVSVENVPSENKQWFVLRVTYGRILKAKALIETKGLECYVPLRYKHINKNGKKRIIIAPLLPSFLFVYATTAQVESLLYEIKISSEGNRNLLSYYFDHTICRQDNPDRNPPLTIRNDAMDNFIRLTSIKNPHIIPVTTEIIQYKLGDMVIVTDGDFKGSSVKCVDACRVERIALTWRIHHFWIHTFVFSAL